MSTRDWLELVGVIAVLAGVLYQAHRAGKSSDNVQKVALRVKRDEVEGNQNSAENSGYTRAQAMINEAAEAQQKSFDATIARMERQMATMQGQLDEQAEEIRSARREIQQLRRVRDQDRQTYTRYIQKLLDLLHRHQIEYPSPPPFFDEDTEPTPA